ncbi:VOC family protein [Streptomyces sp. RFCAC02]|uniref:VOC family protein n=1 Tax=Streptomyces sp. RFCAC02 TaxID=2499143 RepID=UPI001021C6A0|nr:VOC family protein [Streptomyces sp. RFCAC02]
MTTQTPENTTATPKIDWVGVSFDCDDPAALARFWSEALGLPVLMSSDEMIMIGREGSPGIAFCRIENYRRPTWPDPECEKQSHLEFGVADLDAAQARMLSLGATEPSSQPDAERWRVLLDPAGHPFCLFVSA